MNRLDTHRPSGVGRQRYGHFAPLLLAAAVLALPCRVSAQCSGCTITVSSNSSTSYSLSSGQVLCITGGTYTGSINNLANGATICVGTNATFSPSSLNNISGSIVNHGVANMPGFSVNGGFLIENYGRMYFPSNLNMNGTGSITNYNGGYMRFSQAAVIAQSSTVVNFGWILCLQNLNTDAGTNFTNHNRVETFTNFNPNGTFTNNGTVKANDFININSNSTVVNNCTFYADDGFNNNSPNTQNYGTLIVTGPTGNPNDLIQNNAAFFQGPNGKLQAIRYINSSTVTGSGTYRMTGQTTNQGPFGNDGLGINFYDTGLPPGIMDVQNTAPHASVTKNFVAAIDTNLISSTCGATYRTARCSITATASNGGPYCPGQTIQLSGGPAGMATYAWSGSNNWTSAAQSPSIQLATAAMAGTYTLTVTNSNGCTASATTTVTINAAPTKPGTISY